VDDGAQMRIVEVEDVRANPVDQGRLQRIKALRAPENGGLWTPGERLECCNRYPDCIVARPADRASDPVAEGSNSLTSDLIR
jgi:hypothetical protein